MNDEKKAKHNAYMRDYMREYQRKKAKDPAWRSKHNAASRAWAAKKKIETEALITAQSERIKALEAEVANFKGAD